MRDARLLLVVMGTPCPVNNQLTFDHCSGPMAMGGHLVFEFGSGLNFRKLTYGASGFATRKKKCFMS